MRGIHMSRSDAEERLGITPAHAGNTEVKEDAE